MPRKSEEAVARDREKSRLRAAALRAAKNADNREVYLKERRTYEADNAEHINGLRREKYELDPNEQLSKPFIMWDGEGYSNYVVSPGGVCTREHHYMLFGCSHFPYDPLVGVELHTAAMLEYILWVESQYPDAIHVGFSFGYDVDKILNDLSWRQLKHLAEYGTTLYNGYRIWHNPDKMFRVKRLRDGITATIFDVFGFFHASYVTSLIKFEIASEQELAHIIEGKDKRESLPTLTPSTSKGTGRMKSLTGRR